MTDSDYNIVRSSEVLQNVENLAPAKYRQGRKKRQNLKEQNHQEHKVAENELDEPNENDNDDKIPENEIDRHSIDYRA
jgi:hypothetical protein